MGTAEVAVATFAVGEVRGGDTRQEGGCYCQHYGCLSILEILASRLVVRSGSCLTVVARFANVPRHVCKKTCQVPLILEPIWVANILANLSKQGKTIKLPDAGSPQSVRNGGARVCWNTGSFVNSTIIILTID